jgi:hypothetical protein
MKNVGQKAIDPNIEALTGILCHGTWASPAAANPLLLLMAK